MPLISVVMPAYNAENTIREAIESVLVQSFADFELIVINDCSTDSTADIVSMLAEKDHRIRIFHNSKNMGVSATRNFGIAEAKGEWIAFLDSDDIWRNDKLEKQLETLAAHVDAVLCYTASSFILPNGQLSGYTMHAEEKTSYKTLLKKNLISCSSVIVKADVMKGISMPNDAMHEDYYVWLTILKKHKYAYGVDIPLLLYRLSDHSKSANRIRSAKMLYNSYIAVGYGKTESFFLMIRYTHHSITKRYRIKTQ